MRRYGLGIVAVVLVLRAGLVPAAESPRAGKAPSPPTAGERRGEAYAHLMRSVFAARRGEVGRALEEIERWAPSLRQGQIVTKRIRLLGDEALEQTPAEWPEAQQAPSAGAPEPPRS